MRFSLLFIVIISLSTCQSKTSFDYDIVISNVNLIDVTGNAMQNAVSIDNNFPNY